MPRLARRSILGVGTIAWLVALWLAGCPAVLAKEGMRATLVGSFPVDAAPGTTVVLVADVWVPDSYHVKAPVYGSPIGLRLVDVHGVTTEAMGAELDSQRGRYRFEIAMPRGRVIAVEAFIRGTSDLPIAFEPDPLAPATSTAAEPPPPPEPGIESYVLPAVAGLLAAVVVLAVLRGRGRGRPAAT